MRRKYWLILFVTSVLTALLLLTVCPAPAPQPTPTPTPTPTPAEGERHGGTLRIILNPVNLGYPPTMALSYLVNTAYNECLLTIYKDGRPEGVLATDWEISPDTTSITFNLRKGVKFHARWDRLQCRGCQMEPG